MGIAHSGPNDDGDESNVEEEEETPPLSLDQRLLEKNTSPLLKAMVEVSSDHRYIRNVPFDIWDMILYYLELRDVFSFCKTCKAFYRVYLKSSFWSKLIDREFGEGLSVCLAESRCLLDNMLSKKKTSNKEVEEAREQFARRSKIEFIRMYVNRTLATKGSSMIEHLVCLDDGRGVKRLPLTVYVGVNVVRVGQKFELLMIVRGPYTVPTVMDKGEEGREPFMQELLHARWMCWGMPVIPWEVFSFYRPCHLTAKLYKGTKSQIFAVTPKSDEDQDAKKQEGPPKPMYLD